MTLTRSDLTIRSGAEVESTAWKHDVTHVTTPDNRHFVVSAAETPTFEEAIRGLAEGEFSVILGLESVDQAYARLANDPEARDAFDKAFGGADSETVVFHAEPNGDPKSDLSVSDVQVVSLPNVLSHEVGIEHLLQWLNAGN